MWKPALLELSVMGIWTNRLDGIRFAGLFGELPKIFCVHKETSIYLFSTGSIYSRYGVDPIYQDLCTDYVLRQQEVRLQNI